MSDDPNRPFDSHNRGANDVFEAFTRACCGNCALSYKNASGFLSCGARVDDDALITGAAPNPIWAVRKYGKARMKGLLTGQAGAIEEPKGSNPERMDTLDGGCCAMFERHAWKLGQDLKVIEHAAIEPSEDSAAAADIADYEAYERPRVDE